MFNLVYKSVVVECSTGIEDLAKERRHHVNGVFF